MRQLNIRPATQDDLQNVVELFIKVFNQEPWNDNWSKEHAEQYLNDYILSPGFNGVIAEDESSCIQGFIFGIRKRWWDGDELFIHEMCVNTDLQRSGIGAALLKELADIVSKEGIVRFTLLTNKGIPAESFYKKQGFEEIDRLIFMYKELGSD
ncbi:GNAT family N-acetyltransferase [Paenibacillus kobensis]|uniref:GNAT family N-acetyltransferase n=1 Tax=Paenibacillus kobensis TaxID=59841 RepID=UPI000FDC815D|nr:GNAT family N-acetyltransferase [Paenibacillus kobensis]